MNNTAFHKRFFLGGSGVKASFFSKTQFILIENILDGKQLTGNRIVIRSLFLKARRGETNI